MTVEEFAEVVNALAQLGTFVVVGLGVWIAYRQLGSWRPEAQAMRRAQVAEEMISAANDVDAALRYIRSPWSNLPPDDDQDPKSYQWRERLERMDQRRSDFDRLRHAQIRCRAFLADQVLSQAVEQMFQVRQEVWAALGTLASGTETDGDRQLIDFYTDLRWKAWGSYSERDPLGTQQMQALKVIEAQLYPVVRLEPTTSKP